ncbi:MAG: hypothetical protein WCT32_03155 [Patescibacteria group bacterium]|jgi:hypothetical protein
MGDERMERFLGGEVGASYLPHHTDEAVITSVTDPNTGAVYTPGDKGVGAVPVPEASPGADETGDEEYQGQKFAVTIRESDEQLGWRKVGDELSLPQTGLTFTDGSRYFSEGIGSERLDIPAESIRKLVRPEIVKRLEAVIGKELEGQVPLTAQISPSNYYANGVRIEDPGLQNEIYSLIQIYTNHRKRFVAPGADEAGPAAK